ncbi:MULTISPECIES: ABC transporter permease [unclassified Streptomyces]|uniref:ABC transporter permease n=1 Tax=unclassified Streptomyces TaxID=2593676 RepID=UPI0024758B9C|nr:MULTISPECIES: ABC transporter permease [unclassified Streptomyces]MDH6454221.1 ABC-type nitrate/sulfonate/bicarbonate transport system permease component [Streptomyces sp. SAI-119]MDH6495219.1 ABC-type nitrate/sulfonate/bicarbonate transport system permease component [Streptomyces sp. SAI-149]
MRLQNAALGAAGLAAFLALGEAVPRLGLVKEEYFPPTSRIARAFADELSDDTFWTALGDTLTGWALGLAIAATAGIVIGVVLSVVPHLREATASTIEFLRPIPSVALIPLAVLLYGSELRSVLLLVVYASFWQVLIQTLYGVQDVDPVADETARSYGLGTWARVRHVLWPTALPYVMTGVRLAAAVALILAITGELVIGAPGLGARIAVAQNSQAVPEMYALIVVTGLLGLLINVGARTLERRALAWHQSVRGEVAV